MSPYAPSVHPVLHPQVPPAHSGPPQAAAVDGPCSYPPFIVRLSGYPLPSLGRASETLSRDTNYSQYLKAHKPDEEHSAYQLKQNQQIYSQTDIRRCYHHPSEQWLSKAMARHVSLEAIPVS